MIPTKREIRQQVWDRLEKEHLSRFPRPVHGRIPNFVGAEKAANLVAEHPLFRKASVVKVNPDSPQLRVRELALLQGKKILMPAPRLRSGFLLLTPDNIKGRERFAASIKGAFTLGQQVPLSKIPKPDLLVVGSVAVSLDGARIGKGEGYSEIEYGILRELKLVSEEIPIFTTVHAIQIMPELPQDPYDVSVDYIVTPEEVRQTERARKRPEGILWDSVTEAMMREMPILNQLRSSRLD